MLDTILTTSDGGVVDQLADQFGIKPAQAKAVASNLLPALATGLQQKLATGNGAALSKTISNGGLSRFADDPVSLGTSAALDQGKSLLNQIFGDADLSSIASMVGEKAGISSNIVTRMMPIAATALVAVLSKSADGGQGNLTKKLGEIASAGNGGILSGVRGLTEKVLG